MDTANIPLYNSNMDISKTTVALHPLKALLYLKLLCVHPSLVISKEKHAPYYDHLQVRLYRIISYNIAQLERKDVRMESMMFMMIMRDLDGVLSFSCTVASSPTFIPHALIVFQIIRLP